MLPITFEPVRDAVDPATGVSVTDAYYVRYEESSLHGPYRIGEIRAVLRQALEAAEAL